MDTLKTIIKLMKKHTKVTLNLEFIFSFLRFLETIKKKWTVTLKMNEFEEGSGALETFVKFSVQEYNSYSDDK